MNKRLDVALTLCVVVFLTACGPSSTSAPEVAPQADYSLAARTGIEDIDNVLAAVESGDPQQLRSLVRYTSAPCTNADGLGGPPKCREGEAEGTVSEVLPFLSSEGHYMRKDEIANWQGVEATGLYAIYRVAKPVAQEEYFPHGEYAIVLKKSDGSAVTLRIADGGIVRVDDIFQVTQESLEALVAQDALEVILVPQVR